LTQPPQRRSGRRAHAARASRVRGAAPAPRARRPIPRRRGSAALLGGLWLAFGGLLAGPPAAAEVIHLAPEGTKQWGARNLFAPLSSLVKGSDYWYSERRIEIETSPPGAALELFYVRASFQKRYEQTEAPATVVLPSRVEATDRDSVTVRAFLPGYRSKEVRIPLESEQERLLIDLEPVPNWLEGAAQTYFAGRSSLSLLTRKPPVVRVQDRPGGFSVVLNETAEGPDAAAALQQASNPMFAHVSAEQLGEDLMVRIDLAPGAREPKPELRSRQGFDAARDVHVFTLDVLPKGGTAPTPERMQQALDAVGPGDVSGCAAAFDEALRESLDPADLARALSAEDFRRPFLRAAMKRLGEVSPDGMIRLSDGARYDPAVPLELAAAASQPHLAEGYLALLRRASQELDATGDGSASLHGLVAPETAPSRFEEILDRARARETGCRAGA